MKKAFFAVLVAALVISMGAGSAFAAGSAREGSFGISVGMGDSVFSNNALPNGVVIANVVDIAGRYMMTNDMALLAGFGMQVDAGDADSTYLSIMFGARKYLKSAEFSPFVEGKLQFVNVDGDNPTPADVTIVDLSGNFGAEYFFSSQFSMEGSVGFGFGQYDDGTIKDTYFGTRTVGVHANFYF